MKKKQNKIKIKVITNAKHDLIEKINHPQYELRVKTTAKAINNEANIRIIKQMAEYFEISQSNIFLTKGLKSSIKTVMIMT